MVSTVEQDVSVIRECCVACRHPGSMVCAQHCRWHPGHTADVRVWSINGRKAPHTPIRCKVSVIQSVSLCLIF